MCYNEDNEEIYQRAQKWKEESAGSSSASRIQYVYETPAHARVSIRQTVRVHNHAPLTVRALLALLAFFVVGYVLYIAWPYRGLIIALILALATISALLCIARFFALPLIRQSRETREAAPQVKQEQDYPEIVPMYEYTSDYSNGYRSR